MYLPPCCVNVAISCLKSYKNCCLLGSLILPGSQTNCRDLSTSRKLESFLSIGHCDSYYRKKKSGKLKTGYVWMIHRYIRILSKNIHDAWVTFPPTMGSFNRLHKTGSRGSSILENRIWHEDVKLAVWRWRHKSPHFDNPESGVIPCLHNCNYCLLGIHNFNWNSLQIPSTYQLKYCMVRVGDVGPISFSLITSFIWGAGSLTPSV